MVELMKMESGLVAWNLNFEVVITGSLVASSEISRHFRQSGLKHLMHIYCLQQYAARALFYESKTKVEYDL